MVHDRKFRFGVMCSHAASAVDFREKARQAEALGYSTLFVPDHFIDHPLAPMPAMATAAAVTNT
ncbi:MAG: LLM class F420-dependent oxidoreductase, partial [Acidimicrobiia bacterium]